jgi:hypothetical protein
MFFCIFVIIILYIILHNVCNDKKCLQYFIYDTKIPGPTILMIAGTHGNEPAGYFSLKNLKKKLDEKKIKLRNGKIILVPSVNACGIKLGIRSIPLVGDINRKYPQNTNYDIKNLEKEYPINAEIIKLIKKSDFVIDFHEGWGFQRQNKYSMGSTVSPSDTKVSHDISYVILKKLNENIKNNDNKFTLLTSEKMNEIISKTGVLEKGEYSQKNDIFGSLSFFCNVERKNYILVETTGQDDIQPLKLRLQQNNTIIISVLRYFDMI